MLDALRPLVANLREDIAAVVTTDRSFPEFWQTHATQRRWVDVCEGPAVRVVFDNLAGRRDETHGPIYVQ